MESIWLKNITDANKLDPDIKSQISALSSARMIRDIDKSSAAQISSWQKMSDQKATLAQNASNFLDMVSDAIASHPEDSLQQICEKFPEIWEYLQQAPVDTNQLLSVAPEMFTAWLQGQISNIQNEIHDLSTKIQGLQEHQTFLRQNSSTLTNNVSKSFINDHLLEVTDGDPDFEKISFSELTSDPVTSIYVNELALLITELPNGNNGFEQIKQSEKKLKEHIRHSIPGNFLILKSRYSQNRPMGSHKSVLFFLPTRGNIPHIYTKTYLVVTCLMAKQLHISVKIHFSSFNKKIKPKINISLSYEHKKHRKRK